MGGGCGGVEAVAARQVPPDQGLLGGHGSLPRGPLTAGPATDGGTRTLCKRHERPPLLRACPEATPWTPGAWPPAPICIACTSA